MQIETGTVHAKPQGSVNARMEGLDELTSASTSAPMTLPQENQAAPSAYYGPTNFTWLIRGRLGGMPCPGLHRDFDLDAKALSRIGVNTVVTLTEEWQPPLAKFAEHGLQNLYVPIPDMGAPTMEQARETCSVLADALIRDGSIVFHCHAGRGRTGTLLAAMLIWYRPDFDAAIEQVKKTNRYWIESSAQMEFLETFTAARQQAVGMPSGKERRKGNPSGAASKWRNRCPDTALSLNSPDAKERNGIRVNTKKEDNMSLDKALQTAMAGVPECLASGYIDMDSGMLLGIQTIDSHPQEVLDLLAAATADLFQGSSVVQIENIFKTARGTKDEEHYFNEILVFSENLIHMFMRTKKYPAHVICFVCRKSANPGMVMTKARMSLDGITSAF